MSLVVIGLILAAIGIGAALTIRAMARAPLGYQDEAGFHFEPDQPKRKKPTPASPPRRLAPRGTLRSSAGSRHAA